MQRASKIPGAGGKQQKNKNNNKKHTTNKKKHQNQPTTKTNKTHHHQKAPGRLCKRKFLTIEEMNRMFKMCELFVCLLYIH